MFKQLRLLVPSSVAFLLVVGRLAAVLSMSGCTCFSIADFLSYANAAEQVAVSVVETIIASLPLSEQPAADADLEKAEAVYNDAIAALVAGSEAVNDLCEDDFSALAQAVTNAVIAIENLIMTLEGEVMPDAGNPTLVSVNASVQAQGLTDVKNAIKALEQAAGQTQ